MVGLIQVLNLVLTVEVTLTRADKTKKNHRQVVLKSNYIEVVLGCFFLCFYYIKLLVISLDLLFSITGQEGVTEEGEYSQN